MPNFIKLGEEDRIKLFRCLKNEIGNPWRKFYSKFNISNGSFFNYLSGRKEIPKELFDDWIRIAKIKIVAEKILEKPRYEKKEIKEFELDDKLAEILGILNGDGHIARKQVCVVGDVREVDYSLYLKKLFENKFGLNFRLIKNEKEGSFKILAYSTELAYKLTNEYGLPMGRKMGKLRVPNVLKNKELGLFYIRGLFDTDGCFHIRRKSNPMISIASADPRYLGEVRALLEKFKFKISKGNQRVFLYNKADISRFFEEVKPANEKHLKKYRDYLRDVEILKKDQTKAF